MARDVQMSKVYAWQRIAFPGYRDKDRLSRPDVQTLIYRVLADVKLAGGYAPTPLIKFTKRSGGASASWYKLNFTPGQVTQAVVLHELAHALTWCQPLRIAAKAIVSQGDKLPALHKHVLTYFCDQGHGPKYMACFIALMERYAGVDINHMVQLAFRFEMQGWGPWHVVATEKGSDGRMHTHRQRTRETKIASVKIDIKALAYWRTLLKDVP